MKLDASGLLLVAFIVLKLTGVIAWSWWWVLSPFWIPLALFLTMLGIMVATRGRKHVTIRGPWSRK